MAVYYYLPNKTAVSIVSTRPIAGAELLTLIDRMLGILIRAGMPASKDTPDFLSVLTAYTIGQVLAEVVEPAGGASEPAAYQSLTPQTHPNLAAVFSSGWKYDPDAQCERGLDALLSGWRHDGNAAVT